jgi:hypothetical protein
LIGTALKTHKVSKRVLAKSKEATSASKGILHTIALYTNLNVETKIRVYCSNIQVFAVLKRIVHQAKPSKAKQSKARSSQRK